MIVDDSSLLTIINYHAHGHTAKTIDYHEEYEQVQNE